MEKRQQSAMSLEARQAAWKALWSLLLQPRPVDTEKKGVRK